MATVDSIKYQNYPHSFIDLIVVDGCSRDKTLFFIISSISNSDIKMKIYSDGGKGLAYARQMVINNSDNRYVLFVDGDVELSKDFIEKQIDFMERKHHVGSAVGKYMYKEGSLPFSLHTLYQSISYDTYQGNDATIYRVKVVKQVGGFDTNFLVSCEDIDLIARIQSEGWTFEVNEKATFFHNPRETWKGLWNEHYWFGYDGHYLRHKQGNLRPLWHNIPLISFADGLRLAFKAYRMTNQKKSFLLPFLLSYQSIAGWFGFIKGHMDDYGHKLMKS